MSLCQDCCQLDLADLVDDEDEVQDISLHSSIADLERNISSCDLCRLFHRSIIEKLQSEGVSVDQAAWNDPDSPVILRGVQYTDENYESLGLFWVKVRCDRLSPRAYCYFSFYPKDEIASLEQSIVGRPIKPPSEQINLVKDWVRECDEKHSCHSGPTTLPTRVVDVGVEGVKEPQLTITNGEAGRYMTLSHCWGSHPVIRTTSETINDHIKSLPLSILPPTFRDAVLITRSLGVQYIWIDSLCILQDSKEDWELESVKMGTIYASSYLTIAASASADSTGGCFLPRSTSNHVQVKCTRKTSDRTESIPVFIRPRPRDFSHLPQSILHTRAWVTQERLLSARMIHYDSDQLLWECRESRLAEDGVPTDAFTVQKLVWDERLHLSYPFAQGRLSTSEFVWDWYDMVSAYSSRGIAKSYDRLPALSGLAKVMGECTGQRYLAGLWENHLHYGLLWRRRENWLEAPSDGFRAPSWSWASLEGAVTMPEVASILPSGNEMEVTVRIVQAETMPLGLDSRGMLRSGYLQLKGKLRRADPREHPAAPGYQRFSTYRKELAIDFLKEDGVMVGLAVFDTDYRGIDKPLYYLQVSRRAKEPSRWYGLLLEPTDQQQEFRRIGFCRTEEYPLRNWFAHVEEETITIV
ncbi:heterokaryon incompatibility protein [Colletotrichum phormii]|uniref:Heterokaryon incompatibility protein n=1 Tax=Colletotrichum phormii TaxID=359342 RepID=A0AAI9ZJQ0_9PEZI|nr:heterokaryon incompatibility protein [Colletotrichum phormii]KAK1633241.1 heterokaryon incompatibility protein [Colletotrichum phormii]